MKLEPGVREDSDGADRRDSRSPAATGAGRHRAVGSGSDSAGTAFPERARR